MMMYRRKVNPRVEYRLVRNERINRSANLADKFPHLKSLRVNVEYFDAFGVTRGGRMKYSINVAHGKSVFCVNCTHPDCAEGDYELTEVLAEAIKRRRNLVEGEMRCQGTRWNKDRKEKSPCKSILRYKLTLAY